MQEVLCYVCSSTGLILGFLFYFLMSWQKCEQKRLCALQKLKDDERTNQELRDKFKEEYKRKFWKNWWIVFTCCLLGSASMMLLIVGLGAGSLIACKELEPYWTRLLSTVSSKS